MARTIIYSLIGPPCVGKGTQAHLLQEDADFKVIGAGDLLRKQAKNDPICAELINSGKLVPATYIWQLIEAELDSTEDAKIVIDGYPRQLEQIKLLNKYLQKRDCTLHVISMCMNDELLLERMNSRVFCKVCGFTSTYKPDIQHCGVDMERRRDDNAESFATRLNIFNENIKSIKTFAAERPEHYIWDDLLITDDSPQQVNKRFHDLTALDA